MANTYLTRTPSSGGTPTTQTFTLSFWIKKYAVGINQRFFGVYTSADLNTNIKFNTNDTFQFYNRNTSTGDKYFVTNRQFRDTSAWYHFVIAIDTTLSTEADRVKFYVNGVEETSFSENFEPPQNYEYRLGEAIETRIGIMESSSDYLNGALSHFHYIDGTQYSASDFGQYDANGVWTIKTSPSVTYGTNGYFILKDGNSVTDQSGNSNNFTVGGGTLTNTEDSPSNVFATLNPLDTADATDFSSLLSEGNLTLGGAANDKGLRGTLGASSGKFYWEIKANDNGDTLGLATSDVRLQANSTDSTPSANFWSIQSNGTGVSLNVCDNGTFSNNGALQGFASNTIIGIALDMDNGKVYYSFNGVFKDRANQNSDPVNQTNPFFSSLPTDGTFIMPFTENRSSGGSTFWNYGNGYFGTTAVASAGTNASGNGIFEYDVPTGYTALCTKGLNGE